MEVTDIGKHLRLLRYNNNYNNKKFYKRRIREREDTVLKIDLKIKIHKNVSLLVFTNWLKFNMVAQLGCLL